MSGRKLSHIAALILFTLTAGVLLDAHILITSFHISAKQASRQSVTTDTPRYRVAKVVDGDTIDIVKDDAVVRVRLLGIDTPEVVDPRRPVQCFGREASAYAHTLLDGTLIAIETDPTQSTYDKYGRLLAYVYLPTPSTVEGPNVIFINERMIAEGYAHEYTHDVPYRYQKAFEAAEASARKARKGLWAPGMCE